MYMYSMSPFPLLFYCFSLSLYCVESFTHLFFFSSLPTFLFPLPLSLPLISDTNVIKNDLTTVEKKVRRARGRGRWREEGGGRV